MSYVVRVEDPEVRREQIALRADEAQRKHSIRKEYKFRGGAELQVIEIPIGLLVYRLENYRTRDKQLSLMATGKVADGFFSPNRREDPSVQQKQHEILLVQARRGSGETIKPIYDELDKVGEQTDDLIISADGVVVNGNRRLCAMRELLKAEPARFKKFENVICAVLPASATGKEILDLEIGLQMQPETKLPYEWTALGRAVRDLRAVGESDEQIADQMNRTVVEIRRAAKMIDAADMYLGEWLSDPDDFDKLAETEQAFIQIATRNWGKVDNPSQREATRNFDFFVVERRDDLSESAYKLINVIENNPEAFLTTMAKEIGIELKPISAPAKSQLKIKFDEPVSQGALDYGPLVAALVSSRPESEKAKETIKTIEAVCMTVAEQGRNLDKAALKFAQKAETALLAIDMQTAGTATYSEINSVMSRCIELAEKLKADISKRSKKG